LHLREARGPCGAERPCFKGGIESEARKRVGGLERNDIMKWTGEYIVDDTGQCRWHEGLRIQDEHMKSAYRKNSVIEFIIETSAVMGVKVGMA
jgi:hypothetical protein